MYFQKLNAIKFTYIIQMLKSILPIAKFINTIRVCVCVYRVKQKILNTKHRVWMKIERRAFLVKLHSTI